MEGVSNLLIEVSVRPIVRGPERLWTAVAVIGIVAIWFLGRGIVVGTLANYENMTGRYQAHEFSWASPDVTLGLQPENSTGSLTLVGRADHDQRWTLDCAGKMHTSVDIHAGLFRQLLPLPSPCEGKGMTIHSDWAWVPADRVGSQDSRSLSYQLFAVESGADTLLLDNLVRNSSGLYGVEPIEFRSDPEGVLTERWDANWYRDIAQRGYRFDGDGGVQQNVAWPFLFPSLVKGVAVAWRLPVASAMIGLNAVLLLAALLLLFAIGRASGLTHSLSLVAPAWLSFNPFAFFVVGGFSEPLFLTLECLIVLLLLHRKYGISAVIVALLTATRFVGLIGVGWIAITLWYDTSISRFGRLWRIVLAGGAGLLGIVMDVAIKGAQTGYPLGAFAVRKSWQVTPLSVLNVILHPYALFSGGYLLALLLPALLTMYAMYVLGKTWRHAGMVEVRLLLGTGISLVSATLALNPELHSAGRYFLPFAPAIVGLLACVPLRTRSLSFILIATAAGGAFMPFIVERIAMGQPPY
jgi:hypothetical protein